MSRKMSVREEDDGRARAFENESIILLPDVVISPPLVTKIKKYSALIISEDINRAPIVLSRLGLERVHKWGREFWRTIIEVRVLRESEIPLVSGVLRFLGFRCEMTEDPENVWHLRSADERP
jgi:hypothetical protein